MRKILLIVVFSLFIIIAHSQKGQQDILFKISNFLTSLDTNTFSLDSSKHYILQINCNKKRKITNLNVYLIRNGIVIIKSTNIFNNLSFDSLYIISNTKMIKKYKNVVLPFIFNNVDFVKYSKEKKVFNIFDIETTFTLLHSIQFTNKIEILNPIIAFKLEPMY